MKAVALLSGGLDSTVAFSMEARHVILALTFDYGQRAAKREIDSARRTAKRFKVPHQAIALPWLSGGALVDRSARMPRPDIENAAATKASAKAVWVPNRNGVFISIAAAFAERLGAGEVLVGFNKEEAATFPDNSVDFMRAMNRALGFSTNGNVNVTSPTATWDKSRIVKEARRRKIALDLIWPCYEGGRSWCLKCESCKRSLRALS